MTERIVETHWTDAHTAGGCNGCDARGAVLRIRLRTMEVRVCRECLALIRKVGPA